jgi:uncharacterized OB-fold protein
MPRPEPDRDDHEFWDYCAARQLRFQACDRCGTLRHPPTPICHHCQATATRWVEAPPTAVIYTFCVVHHANDPAVAARVPYVVGLVHFPSLPGVRLVTNITDIAPDKVQIGAEVALWWDDIGKGLWIPRFRPIEPASR